jgi:hypothetical protein
MDFVVPVQFLAYRSCFKECNPITEGVFKEVADCRKPGTLPERCSIGELPPEISAMIHEFARPLLRYPREYKEALQELDLQDWPELKAKLSRPEAETILNILQSYLQAHRAEVKAKDLFMGGGDSSTWAKARLGKLMIYDYLRARL